MSRRTPPILCVTNSNESHSLNHAIWSWQCWHGDCTLPALQPLEIKALHLVSAHIQWSTKWHYFFPLSFFLTHTYIFSFPRFSCIKSSAIYKHYVLCHFDYFLVSRRNLNTLVLNKSCEQNEIQALLCLSPQLFSAPSTFGCSKNINGNTHIFLL